MPKIPNCLKPQIWEITLKEIDKLGPQPKRSFKLQELRKFAESLVDCR